MSDQEQSHTSSSSTSSSTGSKAFVAYWLVKLAITVMESLERDISKENLERVLFFLYRANDAIADGEPADEDTAGPPKWTGTECADDEKWNPDLERCVLDI